MDQPTAESVQILKEKAAIRIRSEFLEGDVGIRTDSVVRRFLYSLVKIRAKSAVRASLHALLKFGLIWRSRHPPKNFKPNR